MIATNTSPRIKNETTDAIFNRFIFIPFNHIILEEEKIHELENLLITEAPSIIMLFISGLQELVGNNYKFPVCKKSVQLFKRFILENNSLKFFIDNYIEIYFKSQNRPSSTIDGFRMSKSNFLNAYNRFCMELGINSFEFDYIKKYLSNTYGIQYARLKVERNSNKALWGFDGIRLKSTNNL